MADKKNMLVLIAPLLSVFCALNSCMENIPQGPALGMWHDQAMQHIQNKAYDSALLVLDSAVKMQETADYPGSLGRVHHLKAYIYQVQEKEDLALTHYYHALDAYKQTGKVKVIGELLNNMGKVYEKHNYPDKALKNYQEAYNVLKENPSLALKILNNIGQTHSKALSYHESLPFFHKALTIADQLQNDKERARFKNNLCVTYLYIKDFVNAEKYGADALSLYQKLGDKKRSALAMNNLALIYQETQQWDKALDYFQQSVKIKEKYNDPTLNNGYNNLAGLYQEKQDFKRATHYLDKALALNSSKLEDQSRTLELKSTIAEAQGKFQQSTDYQKQIVALKDSIYSKQDTINDLSYKNLLLIQERVERENTMHKERINYQQQVNRWITIAVVVALVGITVITILYWRLRQATLTMDTYTKNMSHTMRNQFNAILGNAYIVKGLLRKMKVSPEEDTRPEAYEAIRSIGDILQSSAETTTNIITTRHVGKIQAESDLYKPVQAVSANLKTYTPAAREKDITLKEEIISEPMVTAHATTFEHALGNLVSNAIKYSPEGSTVTIRLYDEEGQVFLTVLDEGPGIPEKDKKKLFKKGKKLHNIKNIISSGVGLYYAKRDIEKMGGQMYHKNRKEGGSAFTIEFPRKI